MSDAGTEILRAVEVMQRVDLDNLVEARQLMSSDGLPLATAEELYGPRVSITNHRIEAGDQLIDVRVYAPIDDDGSRAAVLLMHGGAFVGGDLATEHARNLRFAAEAGCVVISPEYGLAPERGYPHALNDCYAVLEWMSDHADEFGVSRAKLVVGGVSAGAALAAGLALLSRDRGGPEIRAQMLLYPVLDDRMATDSMRRFVDTPVWDAVNSEKMWRLYLGEASVDQYAAPGRAADLGGLPPTYLLVAENDPLRDEALVFAGRLLEVGVSVDIRLWGGGYHVFDQLVPEAELSMLSLTDQVNYIRRLAR